MDLIHKYVQLILMNAFQITVTVTMIAIKVFQP